MKEVTRRRVALSLLGAASFGVAGCVSSPGPGESDVSDTDEDADPSDDEDELDDGGDNEPTEGDDDEEPDTEPEPPAEPDPAAVARSTIDYGESIGDFGEWFGPGGSYVSLDTEEAVTTTGSLRVELRGSRFATAGYDFPEPFDLGTRHLSTAVKVDAPTGGQLEFRLRAPSSDRRFVCTRRLPPGMSDWMRVDLGITRGKRSPDADNIQSIRVHVKGNDETDVRYWIDDLRVTESSGESYAILAFYGGRDSHYETVFPLLEERGMRAAIPVSPHRIGAEGRMGLEALRDVQDAGWDICSFPDRHGALPELTPDEQRSLIRSDQFRLNDLGFGKGSRHFFAPQHRVDGETIDIIQEMYETGFHYGGNSAGMPPTAPHTLPVINGGDLDGSRAVILRADLHEQLVVLAFDRIGPDGMSVDDFEAQLDRIESNEYAGGLTVITPSDLVDNHL